MTSNKNNENNENQEAEEEMKEIEIGEETYKVPKSKLDEINKRKEKELKQELEQEKARRRQKQNEALSELLQSAQDELKTTIKFKDGREMEVLADLDQEQFVGLRKLQEKYQGKKAKDLDDDELDEILDYYFEFLGEVAVEYTKKQFKQQYKKNNIGFLTILQITGKIIEKIDDMREQKKIKSRN